jgi:hypothetical protein
MFEHGTPLLPGALTSQREFFLLRCELKHQLANDSIACKRKYTWEEDIGFKILRKLFRDIRNMVCELRGQGKTVDLVWVKGHQGTPGDEKADVLAGQATGKSGYSEIMTIAHLKLRISEKFRTKKEEWRKSLGHHGTEVIPPPPPKKSCLDGMRNALARTVVQIRTGHWRSAVYLKRVCKMAKDKCWFCQSPAWSHVLLQYSNAK